MTQPLPQHEVDARRREEPEWRRRRRRRVRYGLIGLAAAGALAALVLGARSLLVATPEERTAERFADAWSAGDHEAMYELLDDASRAEVDLGRFTARYEEAAATATTTGIEPGDPESGEGGTVVVPITTATVVFGELDGELRLTVGDEAIDWAPHLTFPGLAPDEELRRRSAAPRRAALLARDGTVLAEGDTGERTSELRIDAGAAAGTIGPPASEEEADALYERGFDRDTQLGLTGLERVFERELAGTPGGTLLAGERELAASEPEQAEPVTTTIEPRLQTAAATTLDALGGIAVLDARGGQVRALSGLALTGPQPPGSTFKIVTTVAALEGDVVETSTEFPLETAATIDGTTLSNAGQASCGGTFAESFAESCNSVFAPLGVEVGAERLVETAERFGINGPPAIPGADSSTMPPAGEIESDLELGATAIGQGRLLMTPLRLASISQAIAAGGRLAEPTLVPDQPPQRTRVTSRQVAGTIEELMVDVVAGGTGDAAAIPDVVVAGKTGTAEVGEDITDHAWFTAFAPADRKPELSIAVYVANGGAGGEVAAPIAAEVLEAGL